MIYFDNAATSWPKPPEVKEAMVRFMDEIGANPGRSGHLLSIEAARIIYDAREALSNLFNVKDPSRIVFTLNATESVNLALKGILRPGDHIITSSMEHNSVMRPLRDLEKRGIGLTVIPCSPTGELDPGDVKKKIQSHTKMIVINHASNVTGTLLPIREVGESARENGILFLVDAAQTAGAYPIDIEGDRIDLLAFTGHKSLYGPQGTGGLVIGENVNIQDLTPLKHGGTGSRSEFELQPDFLPDRYESGTPNAVGIAGLLAGVQFVLKKRTEPIRQYETLLIGNLIEGLREIPGISFYGPENLTDRMATLSFNIKNLSPSEVAFRLENEAGILCRPGLHCAPSAHKTIRTFPEGTVRLSLGYFNTLEEVHLAIKTIDRIARSNS
ncbi:MAG: aminotransferase class V-fold PLP-dependent enzyme [Deltaproteobacteria bacterium]|nr:aminotransferase class V-fold PLP-dependent enzyme [Deltaproteobacteria bacterium]